MSGNVFEVPRASSSEFDKITQAALQELHRLQAETRALEQKIYSRNLILQELDAGIGKKQQELAEWNAKVGAIVQHCEELFTHTQNSCQQAVDAVNRIFHPNTFLKGF